MTADTGPVYFVGIDLAWGEKSPTGVAVLGADGRLLHVSAQSTDETISSALKPYMADDCLVAIDAPLVVKNASGNRPAEAALNRDFARFDAGAHPANTGKPEFSGTPRGARLAHALGLDMDPASRSHRRAIEVYPHPAIVTLFQLGRTLKYKNKTGRSLSKLQSELLRLMTLIEGLAEAPIAMNVTENDEWQALVFAAGSAERKSELRRVEDQVDAVVCAYVAMYADRRPHDTTTYGDFESGYIVTPTLAEGHRPSPRKAPVTDEPTADPVRITIQTYAAMQPELREVTGRYVALVMTLLDEAGINYLSVTGRTKSVASFAAKAARSVEGRAVFTDPLTEITDQIGVRVITYLHSDVAAVADLLAEELVILGDRDFGQETADEGQWGYASRHLLVGPSVLPGVPATDDPLHERIAQVQIRTVLQHAWAEFEHAIRYKGTIPQEKAPELDRRFTLAAGLLELADREFSMIRDELQSTVAHQQPDADAGDPRIRSQDLATFLAGRYADAGWSRADHYSWVSGLLLELGITSLDELAGMLTSVDGEAINARMDYRYPAGAVRRLDDALLAVFGARYVGLHGNVHREPLLRTRLEKLRTSVEQPDH